MVLEVAFFQGKVFKDMLPGKTLYQPKFHFTAWTRSTFCCSEDSEDSVGQWGISLSKWKKILINREGGLTGTSWSSKRSAKFCIWELTRVPWHAVGCPAGKQLGRQGSGGHQVKHELGICPCNNDCIRHNIDSRSKNVIPRLSTSEATPGGLGPGWVLGTSVQQRLENNGECSQGPLRWWRDWTTSYARKGKRAGTVQQRREGLEGILSLNINTWREGVKKSQAPFRGAQWQNKGQWAQTEIQEFPSEHQETFFYCVGNQALAQSAQWVCGVPILGHSQKPSGRGPVAMLVWGRLDQMTPRSPFQAHSVIL